MTIPLADLGRAYWASRTPEQRREHMAPALAVRHHRPNRRDIGTRNGRPCWCGGVLEAATHYGAEGDVPVELCLSCGRDTAPPPPAPLPAPSEAGVGAAPRSTDGLLRCQRGHALTEWTTRVAPDGTWACRACMRDGGT